MLTFWDIFKQLETFSVRKAANLAKLLGHLVGGLSKNGNKCLNIGVLKRIEFSPSDMEEMIIVFLSIFMTSLFESCDVDTIQSIFGCDSTPKKDSFAGSKRRRVDPLASDDDDDYNETKAQTTKKEDLSELRESLSIFLLQYMKSSPKNEEGTQFSENLLAAISSCEQSNTMAT
jgi:hypothetical protein